MPIKFRCPSCRQKYEVKLTHAGRETRCQKCKTKLKIPEATSTDGQASSGQASSGQASSGQASSGQGGEHGETARSFRKPPELQAALNDLFADEDDNAVTAGVDAGREVEFSAADPDETSKSDVSSRSAAARPTKPVTRGSQAAPAGSSETGREFPEHSGDEEDEEDEEGLFSNSRAGEDEEMDLTPMVDVTFLLLIFFMITASFTIQKSLEVPAPNPEEEGASQNITNLEEFEEESIMVEIDARNLVMVDEEMVSDLDRLPNVLKSKRKPEILITAHENSLHEVVVRVIDAANEIGMQKIRIGVRKGN